jgi:hypothetical protein
VKSPQLNASGDGAGDLIQICNTPFCPITNEGKTTLKRFGSTMTTARLADGTHPAARFPAFHFFEIYGLQ